MAEINFDKLTPEQISIAKSIAADARKYGIDPDSALQSAFNKNQFSQKFEPHPGEDAPEASKILWERQFQTPTTAENSGKKGVGGSGLSADELIGATAGAATGASAVLGGAGVNAVKNILSGDKRIPVSAPNTGSIGRPLTDWELRSPSGQAAEMRRLEMRDLLDKWKTASFESGVTTDALRTQQEAARRAIEQARILEQQQLARFVTLGGGKAAPELPTLQSYMTTPSGKSPDVVDYHAMNPEAGGTSAAREISQHESAHYRSLSQGARMEMIDRLAKELNLTKDYVQLMLEAGEHKPTATGRVLLPEKDINVVNANRSPVEQMIAAMTPEERIRAETAARERMLSEQGRNLEFNEANRALGEAKSGRTSAATAERSAAKALAEDLSSRGILGAKFAPQLETAQQAMINAVNAAKNHAIMGPIRAAGKVITPAVAGLEGMDALNAYRQKDYEKAAEHGLMGTGALTSLAFPVIGSTMMGVADAKNQADLLGKEIEQNRKINPNPSWLDIFKELMQSKTSTPWMN